MNQSTIPGMAEKGGGIHRISWGAVFAGIVIALIVHSLLNFLALAWGLSSINADSTSLKSIGFSSFAGLMVNNLLAMFAGGWVAGRLSPMKKSVEGMLHGLLSWGSASLVSMILMMAAAGAMLGGTMNVLGTGLSAVGQGVAKTAFEIVPQMSGVAQVAAPELEPAIQEVKEQALQVLNTVKQSVSGQTQMPMDEMKQQLGQMLSQFLLNDETADQQTARQKILDFLTQHVGMDSAKAEQTIDEWQSHFNTLKEKLAPKIEEAKHRAIETLNQTTSAAATFAMVTFFMLLTGGIAAGLGGAVGTMKKG